MDASKNGGGLEEEQEEEEEELKEEMGDSWDPINWREFDVLYLLGRGLRQPSLFPSILLARATDFQAYCYSLVVFCNSEPHRFNWQLIMWVSITQQEPW